jgi:hypothetical protein
MELIFKVLGTVGLSIIKYLIGVTFALKWLNPVEGFLSTTIGSGISVLIYVYGGTELTRFFRERKIRRQGDKYKKPLVFTKKNRFLVKIRKNGGLPLVAFLSPVVISLTVGCLLAITFIHNRPKIVTYMIVSIFIWGLMIFGGKNLLYSQFGWGLAK